MSSVIRTNIVRIGNSQGIRIPKVLLEQVGLTGPVEVEARRKQLVVRAARKPREGWEMQFQQMAERGDGALLDPEASSTQWDKDEWEW
jgi:antitoxin MazE